MGTKNVYRITVERKEWRDVYVIAESFPEATDKAFKQVGEDSTWNGHFLAVHMSGLGMVGPNVLGRQEQLLQPPPVCKWHPDRTNPGWPPCPQCMVNYLAKLTFRELEKGCGCPDQYYKKTAADSDQLSFIPNYELIKDPSYHTPDCSNRS